jgi:hypothetical protein
MKVLLEKVTVSHNYKTETKANWLKGKNWIPIQLSFERLGRRL